MTLLYLAKYYLTCIFNRFTFWNNVRLVQLLKTPAIIYQYIKHTRMEAHTTIVEHLLEQMLLQK